MNEIIKIKYSNGLKNQSFFIGFTKQNKFNLTSWKKIVDIKNPISTFNIFELNKSSEGRKFIKFLISHPNTPILVEFDGCKNFWSPDFYNTFPANLDTLFLANYLGSNMRQFDFAKSVLDLGAGQGFIGQYLFKKFFFLKEIVFSDINRYAVSLSKKNLNNEPKELLKNKKIIFNVGDTYENLPDKLKFDLIISNPPYIPFSSIGSECNGPYLGTKFLERIMIHARGRLRPGGHLIILYSKLTEKIFAKSLLINKGKIVNKSSKIVSFRVKEILENKELLNKFLKENLLKKEKDIYLQEIMIADIKFD